MCGGERVRNDGAPGMLAHVWGNKVHAYSRDTAVSVNLRNHSVPFLEGLGSHKALLEGTERVTPLPANISPQWRGAKPSAPFGDVGRGGGTGSAAHGLSAVNIIISPAAGIRQGWWRERRSSSTD